MATETIKHTYYWPTLDGWDDSSWEADERKRLMDRLVIALGEFHTSVDSAENNTDLFGALQQFADARTPLRHDALQYGGDLDQANLVFIELFRLQNQTTSVYIKRFLDWQIKRELHDLGMWPCFDVDVSAAPDSLLDHTRPGHVVVGYSAETEDFLAKNPQYRSLYEYARRVMVEDPTFGDSDYYAPDPYIDLSKDDSTKDVDRVKLELAIETAALFGVSMAEISQAAQNQLFIFGVELDQAAYDRIARATETMPATMKPVFAESFLATEHGNQLGESILAIAEKCQDHENAAEVFQRINSIRSNMDDWKSVAWFADADSGYSDYFAGIRQGIEMRIAQILSPAPELIDGIPQKAQYFHRDGTTADVAYIASFDQMIQGLKIIEIMTTKIAAAEVASKDSRTASVGNNFFSTRTPVGGSSVRMMMRPHHSNEAEARIRWSVEITPAEQLEIFGEYLEMNKLGEPRSVRASLKLDLEKISDRVSLDLGTRVQYGSEMREYPDRLMAALVTTGVQHDLRKQGKDITHVDYHVRDPFSDKLSDPRHFANFVEAMQRQYVDRYVLELGNVTMKATDVATSPELSKLDVVYTGLFFDDQALRQIADLFPAKYQNTPKNPHITIKFRPIDGLDSCEPGVSHTVKVVGIVDNGQAQALLVESDATEGVMNPHITISTGNNEAGKAIPPSYAKQAIKESLMRGAVTFLDKPVELTGISGYWDGKTGKAVLSAA